jgi:hypothetical protein
VLIVLLYEYVKDKHRGEYILCAFMTRHDRYTLLFQVYALLLIIYHALRTLHSLGIGGRGILYRYDVNVMDVFTFVEKEIPCYRM